MAAVFLRVLRGKHEGKSIPLPSGRFVIGREEGCDLRPQSDMVSRRHCAFSVTDEDVTLADLGSTNGTLVNDVPITETVWLRHGDVVTAGTLKFELVLGEPVPADPTTAETTTAEATEAEPSQAAVDSVVEAAEDVRTKRPKPDDRYTVNLDDLMELPETIEDVPRAVPPPPPSALVAPPSVTPPPAHPDATPIPPAYGTPLPPGTAPPTAPQQPPGAPQPPGVLPAGSAVPSYPVPSYPTPPYPTPPYGESPTAVHPPAGQPYPGATPPPPPVEEPVSPTKPGATPLPVQLPDPSTVGVRDKDAGKPKGLPPAPSTEVNPSEQAADLLKKYAEAAQIRPKSE